MKTVPQTEELGRQSLKVGSWIVFASAFIYDIADHFAKPQLYTTMLPFHVAVGGLGLLGILCGSTAAFKRDWRGIMLTGCGIVIGLGTVQSIISQEVGVRFAGLMLYTLATAVFVPWGARYQVGMIAICLASFGIDVTFVTREHALAYQWLALSFSSVTAYYGANFLEQYRNDLAERNQQLAQLLSTREEMLTKVSFNLRRLLTVLFGQIEALREETDENSTIESIIRNMEHVAQEVHGVALNVLDYFRLESGRMSVQRGQVDANAMVWQVSSRMLRHAENKGVELRLKLEDRVDAIVDPYHLDRILSNILDNAIHYSRLGPVHVQTASSGDSVSIAIQDSGPGISDDELPTIFSRYRSGTRKPGSIGLGLYVSRALLELNGGTLQVDNADHGGSRFVVKLPRSERGDQPLM